MNRPATTPLVTQDPMNAEAFDKPRIVKPAIPGYENTTTLDLLTAMILGEAESEDLNSMRAIASVVPNRIQADSRDFGDDWRKVLLNPGAFYGLSDLTARDRIRNAYAEGSESLQNARRAAFEALSGKLRTDPKIIGATFFASDPGLHKDKKFLGRVGKFYFYQGRAK